MNIIKNEIKKAINTGAGSGRGRVLTEKLLNEGIHVIGVVRSGMIENLTHPSLTIVQGDISDEQSISKAEEQIGKNFRRVFKTPCGLFGKAGKKLWPVCNRSFCREKYYVLQHPDYVKHVWLANHKQYRKPGATKLPGIFLGDGLLTSNGNCG